MFDYIRVSCCVPNLRVGDAEFNTQEIIKYYLKSVSENADIAIFPELCISGYTCGDLFFQKTLQDGCLTALSKLCEQTSETDTCLIVGAPLIIDGQLFNCAVVMSDGGVDGVVPKYSIPNGFEYLEKRWFRSAKDLKSKTIDLCGSTVPVDSNLIFHINEAKFGVELCNDMLSPVPASSYLAAGGAELIVNLSASNETVTKRDFRKTVVKSISGNCICAYAYVSAGESESTTDLIFSGHSIIAENGSIIMENQKYIDGDYSITADIDLGKIRADRIRNSIFADCSAEYLDNLRIVTVSKSRILSDGSLDIPSSLPFIPETKAERLERCRNIFDMQVAALRKRMSVVGSKLVIGISGGLDSTLALLVSAEAVKRSGKPLSDVIGITMPAFGTSDRTYNNSLELMRTIGITIREINIKDACINHMKDLGHDINVHDITYENSQARERTQVLMDAANQAGGIVVGTGDLSEMVLGWCTYNGDHMSMYGVNSGIPKTLIRWMIASIMENDIFPESNKVLEDILDTPISPELLPPDEEGKIAQKTEDVVGPYTLHDFYLYYVLRYGFSPSKIFELAKKAFTQQFDDETILKWLKTFYRRFFTQQFKRSCIPDGVKIGSVGISPRGDWKMPSDASSRLWLDEVENL